jgi:hypothetical protein
MNAVLDIEKKKELFDLPFKQNELEYWGPTDREFSNSFLAVAKDFLERTSIEKIDQKKIFTAIIELIQNISEYYELAYENLACYPDVYFNVFYSNNRIEVKTVNKLKAEDVKALSELFDSIFSLSNSELEIERAKAIIKGKSLGLIMIRRMENAYFNYSIQRIGEDDWLLFDLKIEA